MTKMITDLIDQLTYSSEVQLFLVKVILLRTLFFFTQNLGAYHNNYHQSQPFVPSSALLHSKSNKQNQPYQILIHHHITLLH